jgi:beta-glucuronidase
MISAAMSNLPGRNRTSLNGIWKFILDPFDVADRKPRARRAFWEDTTETRETGLIEYEWSSSPEMSVPGDWNTAERELWYYEGPVYFRRDLRAVPKAGVRQFLYFEAVNYAATVWLNGKEIARHEGGFTPFEVEITKALEQAASRAVHTLVVRADSRHGAETIPGVDFDWKNWGGITRPVWLVETPLTFIRDVSIQFDGREIDVAVELDGPDATGLARVLVPELGLETEIGVQSGTGRARLRTPRRGLTKWSPGTPKLYEFIVEAGTDRWTDKVGLRTIEARGTDILLNGQSIYLRGICLHEEAFGPEATRSVSLPEARALLEEARALGCNFIRLAHYPHADHVARLADEMGLLLWAEIPVYWEEIAYSSPKTLALAREMMAELVMRDRLRASIIMWSVANETPISPERTAFLETIIADTRALDPTRLITAALNKNVDVGGVVEGESRIVVNDPLGASLDVVAINQYEAWYSKRTPGEIRNVSFRNTYEKPFLFSEFGACALYGYHGPRDDRWTEEYQAWLFEETLKVVDATPGCVGLTPWLLKDFRSPRRWHGQYQEMWNRKGVVSPEGHRKMAFSVLRDFYRSKTV